MTTLTEIIEELRTAIANGEELEDLRDNSHEWVDGYLPIYYNRIVEEWQEMPSEYNDRGHTELGMGEEINIYNLMSLDLYMYYSDLVSEALDELEKEAEEVSE
jgi:hypothetical protein